MRKTGFMSVYFQKFVTASFGLFTVLYSSATAQDTVPDFSNYVPQTVAVRISPDVAPRIDGDLSDPAWQQAQTFDNFYEIAPDEGGPPQERTQVYILYDENNLYIGIHAFDSSPEDIKASIMVRDQNLRPDDSIFIILDPSNTHRDGYFFSVNPNGVRQEGLIENNSRLRGEWDTIWSAKATQVSDGWIAEVAIPFRSISYDENATSWGLQVARTIRAENTTVRWANINNNRRGIDLTQIGEMSGITDVSSGLGLEVQVFGTLQYSAIREEPRDEDLTFQPSGNAYYKITPSLTGTLTLNTDFSDTPLDSRQVNTGRFSLFFPETRDFFLQDASVFEFGGNVFNNPNGLPFFSRRIGIVDGAPTDIRVGAKLSGVLGKTNIGALVANTASIGDFDSQTLAAMRISQPVLKESKIGFIIANGDPQGLSESTVAGVDFQYKNSDLPNDARITADFVAIRSEEEVDLTGVKISGNMYAADFAYRSDKWNTNWRYRDIDDNYDPKLGFTNRNGIKQYDGNLFRQFRPNTDHLRFVETGIFARQINDQNGNELNRNIGAFLFARSPQGDRLFAEYIDRRTVLTEGFDLAGTLAVPAGTYDFSEATFNLFSGSTRKISAGIGASWTDIYDGKSLRLSPEITWRPNKHFALEANYNWVRFEVPIITQPGGEITGGDLQIHSASVETDINFSPDMTLSTELQYDNISESFAWFSRFRWEPKPETEVFISFGHSAEIEEENFPNTYVGKGTSLSFRIGQTARF